jgi:uncharacterized membrane protein YtjA (UPF0391 family)
MLRLALILLAVALVAALFGFGGVANVAASGAQLFLFGFIILAVLGLLFAGIRNL